MKVLILFVGCVMSMQSALAQLVASPVCPAFQVDVLDGNINKLVDPKTTYGEIKKTFPCFTESIEKADSARCVAIFYKDKGLSFYPERNYFEIGENFKGKLTPALMGESRSNLFRILGHPKIKDVHWDAFQTEYGTLVLYYNKAGKINKLQISTKSTESLKLCQ